jgi:hypothetical protein
MGSAINSCVDWFPSDCGVAPADGVAVASCTAGFVDVDAASAAELSLLCLCGLSSLAITLVPFLKGRIKTLRHSIGE